MLLIMSLACASPPDGPRPQALPVAHHFDFPVGPPDAVGYYDAQPFGKNHHLGNDWNGRGGGNTDLGDPVYAIANGWVSHAEDLGGGWGNVLRVVHQLPDGSRVESLYAHLNHIDVPQGSVVKRGQRVGSIGDAHGQYWAHLHLEIRAQPGLPVGPGYRTDTTGYLDPSAFIRSHHRQ